MKAPFAFILLTTTLGLPIKNQTELACSGDITLRGRGTTHIENELSIIDYGKRTLKPPLYATLPILRTYGSTIIFGFDNDQISTVGRLERISGKLSMNVMRRSDRRDIDSGMDHSLANISAICTRNRQAY